MPASTEALQPPDLKVNLHQVGAASITWFPNWVPTDQRTKKMRNDPKLRVELARGDVTLLALIADREIGVRNAVVDGGSSILFRQAMNDIGVAYTHSRARGISSDWRTAFMELRKVQDLKMFISKEAEKDLSPFYKEIISPILLGTADFVIVERELETRKRTYPKFQFEAEVQSDSKLDKILKETGLLIDNRSHDWTSGIWVMRNNLRLLTNCLKKYSVVSDSLEQSLQIFPERHLDFKFFPVIAAIVEKIPIEYVTIPFEYPEIQRQAEESPDEELMEKRNYQSEGSVNGTQALLEVLLHKDYSTLRPGGVVFQMY